MDTTEQRLQALEARINTIGVQRFLTDMPLEVKQDLKKLLGGSKIYTIPANGTLPEGWTRSANHPYVYTHNLGTTNYAVATNITYPLPLYPDVLTRIDIQANSFTIHFYNQSSQDVAYGHNVIVTLID